MKKMSLFWSSVGFFYYLCINQTQEHEYEKINNITTNAYALRSIRSSTEES
jgi:hypothetical protein